MPTYEYACTSCGHHLEVVQSFSDEPLTSCPNCGEPLRKVFGSIGIVLKGSGFYKTDNRRSTSTSSKSGSSTSESSTSESSTGSSSTSSDSSGSSTSTSASSSSSDASSSSSPPAKAASS